MGMELQMLTWSIVLGLVQLVIAATLATQQRGLAWNAGPRDGTPLPLTGVAARMDRAMLAVFALQRTDAHTALGAQLYFWGRVVYVPLYGAGIPYARTIAWAVSLVGLLYVLFALF
jgi:uncharacterized MAPEG superfamily protein